MRLVTKPASNLAIDRVLIFTVNQELYAINCPLTAFLNFNVKISHGLHAITFTVYEPGDDRMTIGKVADILSLSEADTRELLKRKPEEAQRLAMAMEELSHEPTRQWAATAMCMLPSKHVSRRAGDIVPVRVSPPPGATLYFLNVAAEGGMQEGRLEAIRQRVCGVLRGQLYPAQLQTYGPLVAPPLTMCDLSPRER
jgi:hypothetical protein